MPTYEYKCDACGHAFEQMQSIKADPVRKCPACKKLKVRRLISSGAGMIFKGSGFYITDYRDAGYKEKAKADSGSGGGGSDAPKSDGGEPKSTGDSKPSGGAEPKPAAKAESKAESKPAPKAESSPAPSPAKPAKDNK